jgi:hypothetical protein
MGRTDRFGDHYCGFVVGQRIASALNRRGGDLVRLSSYGNRVLAAIGTGSRQ